MKLIHFQGLNCYHDRLVTLADSFGLDYTAAFSGLWSESRLRYDEICDVFLSVRLEQALESLGLKLDAPCVAREDREAAWSKTPAGSYAVIGIDAGLIPWSPLYQLLHGPHYFIVHKGIGEPQCCFDPTYGLSGETLTAKELVSNSYALIPVKKHAAGIPPADGGHDPLFAQSQEVLDTHPGTLSHFFEQANTWMKGSKTTALLPAKFVVAMLTGRYLFKYFLEQRSYPPKAVPLFFSHKYYEDWSAVKNGFYKAALTRPGDAAFHEACNLLTSLFEQEIALSKQIRDASHGLNFLTNSTIR